MRCVFALVSLAWLTGVDPTLLWIGQAWDSAWQSNGESHLKGYRYSGHDWKGALGPPALGYLSMTSNP